MAATVLAGFRSANINQYFVKMEVGKRITPEYRSVFLNSDLCRPQFDRAVTGSSRLALDYPSIRNLRILFPADIGEQKRTADAVLAKLDQASALRTQADAIRGEVPKIPALA